MNKPYKSTIVQNIIGIIFLAAGGVFSLIAIATLASRFLFPDSKELFMILFVTFISVGLPFLIVGSIFRIYVVKSDKRINMLVSEGHRITAKVINYRYNVLVMLNKRHPVKLICEYTDYMLSNPIYYTSDNYWGIPDMTLNKSVSIYIDRSNSANYYVDISGLYNC